MKTLRTDSEEYREIEQLAWHAAKPRAAHAAKTMLDQRNNYYVIGTPWPLTHLKKDKRPVQLQKINIQEIDILIYD